MQAAGSGPRPTGSPTANPQLAQPAPANPELEALKRYLRGARGRLYTGLLPGGLALTDAQQALLVLGPPRSGKTSALAVPNVLCAPGPVIATSTKLDLMSATLGARSGGRRWLLDPTGSVLSDPPGVTRLRWSPVSGASTWDGALLMARSMTRAARPRGRLGESAHWTERAEALLAPLLHAASITGAGMDSVARWALRQELSPAQTVLATHGTTTASDVLAGIAATDPREQSGIWSSLAGVLAAYRSDAVLDNASCENFDPAALPGSNDTIYICAPARQQDLAAPIVVAFLEQVRSAVYAAHSRDTGLAQLTLVLDEVANIAPLPDLPALVSEGGGQGVSTIACLQDLSQAKGRWGQAAEGFLSLFGTKVVLPGIGDMATLETVSRLAGDIDVPVRSVSHNPASGGLFGSETVTWSNQRQRRLPPDAVNQQPPGCALMLCGAAPPVHVGLPPWWATVPFSRAVAPVERARTLGW
ncbi:MAG TPA: type IV secretory system conjugative DNA transfer family protein [Acidimicrobiales bacterium]|nr:type IV secretory system conjugative DNA transfer family protein [Acidimicrobiales bacterium]